MECTHEMLTAAVKAAVNTGLLPRYAIGEESYLKNWAAVSGIMQAGLDAAPGAATPIDPLTRASGAIAAMTNEARLDLFSKYCRGCGVHDPKCKCWNDD
jgi:hypothetical protein